MNVRTPPEGYAGRPPLILVVEDDDPVRAAICRLLTVNGFETIQAKTAAEAELMLSEKVAAMVLDFRLPGSRGDLFFYYVSAKFTHLRGATVFLTGDTSAEAEALVAHTGCVLRYKPFVDAALIALLWSMVARRAPQPADAK